MSDLPPANTTIGGFDWVWRTSAFCMLVVAYCLYCGEDLRLYETAVTAAFTLLGMIGGSYIAGAAWEHRSLVAGITRRPPKDEEQ